MNSDYMRGRRDERASIIGWLRAEARDDPVGSWSAVFNWAAKALENLAPTSEVRGTSVHRIKED